MQGHRLGRQGYAAQFGAPSTASGTALPWRAARTITFSGEPYMLNEQQLLVVKKDAGIKSWDDAAGKDRDYPDRFRLRRIMCSRATRRITAATFATLDTMGESTIRLYAARAARSMPCLCDCPVISLPPRPDAYTQLDEPLSAKHYAVGFKKSDTQVGRRP